MEQARVDAWKLAHDVGKYASRTARNLPSGQIPSGIAKLFYKDLFETDGDKTALSLFEELAKPLQEIVKDGTLRECRRILVEIEGLEEQIRDSKDAAIRHAAALVIEVDLLLRKIAKEIDGIGS